MKIVLSEIASLGIYANDVSLKAYIHQNEDRSYKIKSAAGIFVFGEHKFPCQIASATESKRKSLLLKLNRSLDLVMAVFGQVGRVGEYTLLIEETVDPALYQRAFNLLNEYSVKTGRPREALLKELTTFKPGVEGREELRFVSEKQLVVISKKMEEKLNEINQTSEGKIS